MTREEKKLKIEIVKNELREKIKDIYMSFLSKKISDYPLFLTKEDIISVLASLIVEENQT